MASQLETTALLPSSASASDDNVLSSSFDDNSHGPTEGRTAGKKPKYIQLLDWFLVSSSIVITTIILIPSLLGSILFLYSMTDRLYPSTIHSFHMTVSLILISITLSCFLSFPEQRRSFWIKIVTLFSIGLDICLCWFVYPSIFEIYEASFVDIDGTIILDWTKDHRQLWWIQFGMSLVISLRILQLLLIVVGICILFYQRKKLGNTTIHATSATLCCKGCPQNLLDAASISKFQHRLTVLDLRRLRPFFVMTTFLSLIPFFLCIRSCKQYIWSQEPANTTTMTLNSDLGGGGGCCDDLDSTECALPFPSFHLLIFDSDYPPFLPYLLSLLNCY